MTTYPHMTSVPAPPLPPTRVVPAQSHPVLRFAVDKKAADRRLEPGEHYYRIELADGREVLIAAEGVSTEHGTLVATTAGTTTLMLSPGSWASVYRCAVLSVPWCVLHLEAAE
ncbi:hypothetical protein [Mycobacteroides chelonae]